MHEDTDVVTPDPGSALDKVTLWARINSPWAVHFNSGSCNGCDIEILATLTPRYDLERFGIKLRGSPRHADVLMCTGPVTRQARERLVRIYEQMPDPKFVVAVGSCGITGGAFQGCYNIVGRHRGGDPGERLHPGLPAAARGDHRRRGPTADQAQGGRGAKGGRDARRRSHPRHAESGARPRPLEGLMSDTPLMLKPWARSVNVRGEDRLDVEIAASSLVSAVTELDSARVGVPVRHHRPRDLVRRRRAEARATLAAACCRGAARDPLPFLPGAAVLTLRTKVPRENASDPQRLRRAALRHSLGAGAGGDLRDRGDRHPADRPAAPFR